MKIKSQKLTLTALLCAAVFGSASPLFAAPSHSGIYTPRPTSKERVAIFKVLGKPVAKFTKTRRVVFTGVKMRANKNWAYVDADTVDVKGKPIGPDFTNSLAAVLRKSRGQWRIVEWAYSTDVISMGWEAEHPEVPKKIWPHNQNR